MPTETAEEKLAFPPTKVHKGLLNGIGENNCFLNVTIQALWHLGPFRAELRKFIADHKASSDTDHDSLLEAVCNTFVQYLWTLFYTGFMQNKVQHVLMVESVFLTRYLVVW